MNTDEKLAFFTKIQNLSDKELGLLSEFMDARGPFESDQQPHLTLLSPEKRVLRLESALERIILVTEGHPELTSAVYIRNIALDALDEERNKKFKRDSDKVKSNLKSLASRFFGDSEE